MDPAPTYLEAFKENPIWFGLSILSASAALVLLLVALVLTIKKARTGGLVAGILAACLGLGAIGSGAVGRSIGRSHTDAAATAAGLTAHDRARIVAYGYAESGLNLTFGLAVGLLPVLGGLALAAAAAGSRPRAS
jgi:hypothetical protein